ncbi:hypothetical protein B0H14DRAFT_2638076 [Mycena olivaceomarginata]|nr:hypothetical protein B0H14DRAFT_2638076 [Mycena olivaceomarginata]
MSQRNILMKSEQKTFPSTHIGNSKRTAPVPKEERKNLRLWAERVPEKILTPHLEAYAAALNQGWQPEWKYLKTVYNEFHIHISWKLPDHEEEWDPSAIVAPEQLSEDNERRKHECIKLLNAVTGLEPTKYPFAVLLAKLSGLSAPPKTQQAFQQYMRECYNNSIAPVVAEQWMEEHSKNSAIAEQTREPKAGFLAQKVFGDRVKKQAAEAKAAYVSTLNSPPPATPEEHQKCIANLHNFVGPILQGIHGYTGVHAILIVGGLMPGQGGELSTLQYISLEAPYKNITYSVSLSYGYNNAVLPQHWGLHQ